MDTAPLSNFIFARPCQGVWDNILHYHIQCSLKQVYTFSTYIHLYWRRKSSPWNSRGKKGFTHYTPTSTITYVSGRLCDSSVDRPPSSLAYGRCNCGYDIALSLRDYSRRRCQCPPRALASPCPLMTLW